MRVLLLTLILLISSFSSFAKRQPEIYDGFGKNVLESFSKNIAWHLTAIGLTPVIIQTGIDTRVHNVFDEQRGDWFKVGDAAGYLAPFAVSIPLMAIGKTYRNNKTLGAGFAVVQTSVITLSTVSLLKSFTGRPPPDVGSSTSIQKQSREFNFGFLNRGIYDGWPSGHMATVTSIASTLMHYYPELNWVKYAGYVSMSYIMLTVSAENRGQFHWFSDGVAGGLMGWAIGRTVGSNMRASINGIEPKIEEKSVHYLPIISPGKSGIQVVWFQ